VGYENILLDIQDGVALLTLNRPNVFNSLNVPLMTEVRAVLKQVAESPDIRVLVMTGAGEAFCAGADLTAAGRGDPEGTGEKLSVGEIVSRKMKTHFNPLVSEIYRLEKPVICAVNGVAAGGGVGVALATDIVIAARSAYFLQVFGPRLGIVPDCGCTWFLPRLVGRARALGLALLGDKLPAEQAAEWGLIWKCVDDGALMDEAMALAKKLAEGPTRAYGYIKKAYSESERNRLDEQLEYERFCQRTLCDTADFMEGVTAFLEKRPAHFKGR
jgi:2-(1,2-epoxy-1,2-dihydrophenyl)acetyl-CoA isomerase